MITNASINAAFDPGHVELMGLSTDAKPTDVSVNSLFIELNTGDIYYFDGSVWAKVGA